MVADSMRTAGIGCPALSASFLPSIAYWSLVAPSTHSQQKRVGRQRALAGGQPFERDTPAALALFVSRVARLRAFVYSFDCSNKVPRRVHVKMTTAIDSWPQSNLCGRIVNLRKNVGKAVSPQSSLDAFFQKLAPSSGCCVVYPRPTYFGPTPRASIEHECSVAVRH